jgi:hypothetical protein
LVIKSGRTLSQAYTISSIYYIKICFDDTRYSEASSAVSGVTCAATATEITHFTNSTSRKLTIVTIFITSVVEKRFEVS